MCPLLKVVVCWIRVGEKVAPSLLGSWRPIQWDGSVPVPIHPTLDKDLWLANGQRLMSCSIDRVGLAIDKPVDR